MTIPDRVRALALLFTLPLLLLVEGSAAQTATPPATADSGLPSETPAKFEPVTDSFDHVRRDVMIPMRDGVKLHTVILVPKGAQGAPILLTRTPYDADALTQPRPERPPRAQSCSGYDNATDVIVEGGYIRVVQDVRGKYGSEGDYVMNRPLRGPQNPTPVDHATDTCDTIDWLVKNVPETQRQGRHPRHLLRRLPAADGARRSAPGAQGVGADEPDGRRLDRRRLVPQRRLPPAEDALHLRAGGDARQRRRSGGRATSTTTTCSWRRARPASWGGAAASSRSASGGRSSSTRATTPSGATRRWTSCWRRSRCTVPVMLVHSLWDQEDIYGAHRRLRGARAEGHRATTRCSWSWARGTTARRSATAARSGALRFGSDTALHFRREILRPFLDQYLKDGAPEADVAPVTAFETGTNTWRRLPAWPAGCASGCTVRPTPLYLARRAAGWASPRRSRPTRRSRSTSPTPPSRCPSAPARSSPSATTTAGPGRSGWSTTSARPPAAPTCWPSSPTSLTAPVKISGQPIANLVASTSGTDSDWVVKLIDVYPDEVAGQPEMGGYQLMVSADIFRGRYRESLETPQADRARRAAALPLRAADREPRLPAGPPDHGAGPVELVPALRPQPADLRAEHLLGQAGGLPEGRAADLPRARPGELRRAAAGHDELTTGSTSRRPMPAGARPACAPPER